MNKLVGCVVVCMACGLARTDTLRAWDGWSMRFVDASARLELVHAASGARVEGTVSFTGPAKVTGAGVAADAETAAWRVTDSRDGVKGRLALVDPAGNVNGYLPVQPDGSRLSLLVYHRTAFAFEGELKYEATVSYRPDAISCRVTPKAGDCVLSVKSGAAVSRDDDALFSASADEALTFSSGRLAHTEKGWRLDAALAISEPTQNALSVSVLKDYFRSRWVPCYCPLDRTRAPQAPTGWLSWNTYFDRAGSKENLAEARFAAKWLKPFGLEIWNIESWQDNSDRLPVSKFHNMNLETYKVQFPEGMKWLADEIRKLGFKPGLWMAPYGTGNEAFYQAHKGWFLHDAKGAPIRSWNGKFTLDPTVPEALDHLTKIFDKASHDWGYEFFKIDGMSGRGPGYCAHLYERPEIRARFLDPNCPNPFERTVAAFRKGIGDDRVFLACQGHFTGAEAGYADASRTGADIVHPNKPVSWQNILLQARCTINQIFVHSLVFWSDPDCMLVGQGALAREQAQVETTVVALPGQQTFAGDKLAELAPDRVRLIQQALPVCATQPGKLYPQFGYLPVWDLHIARPFGDWHVVALFNWGDAEARISVDWDELGESSERQFFGWEFWTDTFLGAQKERLELAVPARGVRLVALRPDAGRPQVLTTDRHVTQGGVELKDERWKDRSLTTTVHVVGGFPLTIRFAIPEGFALQRISALGARVTTAQESEGRVLAVTLASDVSADVSVQMAF